MAFKPFSKPKSVAEIEAEVQRENNERLSLIKSRATIVLSLKDFPNLSEWEVSFVNSMHYLATTYGMSGTLGEKLAELTGNQAAQLERLCLKYGITKEADMATKSLFAGPTGLLARQAGLRLPLMVLESARGFYLGTADEEGPVSRESVEYWSTNAAAEKALAGEEGKDWTQRSEP